MEIEVIQAVYRRYAPRYDLYFGKLFEPGRRAVIDKLNCRPGDRILEVGVGTGLSLPLYPAGARVTGIDISAEMLAHAQERAAHLGHVEALQVMDAEHMSFADDSFDKVVAMYVASVVPDPGRLVAEMRRVCKPDGELFIVNHFHSTHGLIRWLESLIAPLSRLMGFRPNFCLESFVRDTDLEVIDRQRVNLFGYWTLLRARTGKPAASVARPVRSSGAPAARAGIG